MKWWEQKLLSAGGKPDADLVFEWDFETDTIVFSGKNESLLGFDFDAEQASANSGIIASVHPDDVEIAQKRLHDTYRNGEALSFEFRVKANDDSYLWMRTRSSAVLDAAGSPNRAVGVFCDVTEQKELVARLVLEAGRTSVG